MQILTLSWQSESFEKLIDKGQKYVQKNNNLINKKLNKQDREILIINPQKTI